MNLNDNDYLAPLGTAYANQSVAALVYADSGYAYYVPDSVFEPARNWPDIEATQRTVVRAEDRFISAFTGALPSEVWA